MGSRQFYVYILASRIGGTLYIGVTNDLIRRIYEHQQKFVQGFTKRYDVTRLVYFEVFEDIEQAIHREKRLKKWPRAWKISLIEKIIRTGSIFIRRLQRGADRPLEYWIARSSPTIFTHLLNVVTQPRKT